MKRYSSPDPLAGLLEMVKIEHGLAADTQFQEVKSSSLTRCLPSDFHLGNQYAGLMLLIHLTSIRNTTSV